MFVTDCFLQKTGSKSTANDFLRSLFDDFPNQHQPMLFQVELKLHEYCCPTTASWLSIYVLCIALLQTKFIHSEFWFVVICYTCFLTNHPATSGPIERCIPLWLDMIWACVGQTQSQPKSKTSWWYCPSLAFPCAPGPQLFSPPPRMGLFGHQIFSNVPGMSEWAHNARGPGPSENLGTKSGCFRRYGGGRSLIVSQFSWRNMFIYIYIYIYTVYTYTQTHSVYGV